jgi:steroid 5-alpha reductase family enzyme
VVAVLSIGLAAFLSLAMALAWAIAIRSGKSGLIDATWSFAVGLAAIAASVWPLGGDDYSPRKWLIAAYAAAWSWRLGVHIFSRSLGSEDDPRYAKLKAEWGPSAPRRLFVFLQIQAVCGWPLVGAALLAAHAPFPGFRFQDMLAGIVFVVALTGETVADRQMADFRANPGNRGGICEDGLWAWSRHPNYFFEWLVWVAYAVAAVDFSGAYPQGWLSLAAPALMYVLLVYVSGVPPLEEHLERTRPAAFGDYARRVSRFWPLPPKRRA